MAKGFSCANTGASAVVGLPGHRPQDPDPAHAGIPASAMTITMIQMHVRNRDGAGALQGRRLYRNSRRDAARTRVRARAPRGFVLNCGM